MHKLLAHSTLVILLFLSTALHAQRRNTLYVGFGSTGYQIGVQHQFSNKFSIGGTANYLLASPTVYTTLVGEDIRVKAMVNSPQGTFAVKWKPFGKEKSNPTSEHQFKNQGLYVFAGSAYRLKPVYNTIFTFRDPLVLGEFNLTQEQTGKVQVDIYTNYIQPFLGLGGELFHKKSKYSLTAEAGMIYHGRPRVEMNSTGTLQLNDRNQQQIQQNISNMKFFPMMNLLFGIKL